MPRGWRLLGRAPEHYTVETRAPGTATLRSRVDAPRGFGTLMQTFSADDVRGRRLRLSATVETRGVRHWSGLWMRVDGARKRILAFDNMQDRPLVGDTAPTRHAVVLDVPDATRAVAFGVILDGAGEVSIGAVAVEVVGADVPTTDTLPELRAGPQNLDFAE